MHRGRSHRRVEVVIGERRVLAPRDDDRSRRGLGRDRREPAAGLEGHDPTPACWSVSKTTSGYGGRARAYPAAISSKWVPDTTRPYIAVLP